MTTRSPSILLVLSLSISAAACDEKPKSAPAGSPTAASDASATAAGKGTSSGPSAAISAAPTASSSSATTAAAPAPRPLYYDRALTDADLAGRTLRELYLMRNTIYARAGNSFRKPWLDAYFRREPWYKPNAVMDESKLTAVDRENARKIADADTSITRADLERRRDEVITRRSAGKGTPEDEIELSLLSQRLGAWVGGDEKPAASRSPLEDPSQLDRLLRVEELNELSVRDLRILRNTIFARRGRPFVSPSMKEYFSGMAWYRADDAYTDARLNEIDHKNLRIIQSVETSLGGPLGERGRIEKEDIFSGA